jgi:hypothetical protein
MDDNCNALEGDYFRQFSTLRRRKPKKWIKDNYFLEKLHASVQLLLLLALRVKPENGKEQ